MNNVFDLPELLNKIVDSTDDYNATTETIMKWLGKNDDRILRTLVELYPDGLFGEGWDMVKLSKSSFFYPDMIDLVDEEYYAEVYRNMTIRAEYIPLIPDEFIGDLSNNPTLTWDIVGTYPDRPWNFMNIAKKVDGTVPSNLICDEPWYYVALSRYVTWDTVKTNQDKPWDYRLLSKNPNITWDIVKANSDKPWNYVCLLDNPNITSDIILDNPHNKWSLWFVSRSPNITWEVVQANQHIPWNYDALSFNPNITWDIVEANRDKPWYYNAFISSPDVDLDTLREKKWLFFNEYDEFSGLGQNPNVTLEFIKSDRDFYHFYFPEDAKNIRCSRCIKEDDRYVETGIHGGCPRYDYYSLLNRRDIIVDFIKEKLK